MPQFRMVRQFGSGLNITDSRAYRVESTELLTEAEAYKLMESLGSPYEGRKYEPAMPATEWGTDYWGEIMSEPTQTKARQLAGCVDGIKLFKRAPMGKWELVQP